MNICLTRLIHYNYEFAHSLHSIIQTLPKNTKESIIKFVFENFMTISKMPQYDFSVGIISAHGIRCPNTYVVVSKNVLIPICDINTSLKFNEKYNIISGFLSSPLGKNIIMDDNFRKLCDFDALKKYQNGNVIENNFLDFYTIHDKSKTFTPGGIYTANDFVEHHVNIDNKSKEEISKLMFNGHDDKIIELDKIHQRYTLGDVLHKFGQIYTNKKIVLSFCRENVYKIVPPFFTLDNGDDYMFENFNDKIEYILNLVKKNVFTEYVSKCSALKLSVSLSTILNGIKQKINKNGIIDSYDYHTIIQIYNGHSIPNECVIYGLKKWFSINEQFIKNLKEENVNVNVNFHCDKQLFLSKLSTKFSKYANNIVLNNEIDYVISSVNTLMTKKSINDKHYKGILY
jgi:hypothetical protein